jgi:hypothetical protein
VGAAAASVGGLAELVDVHVHQLAGLAFVAQGGALRRSDHLSGHRVELAQVGHAVASQDAAHCSRWDSELGSEPVLTAPVLVAGRLRPLLDPSGDLGGQRVRSRGPVVQAGLALGRVSSDPLAHIPAADSHRSAMWASFQPCW